MGVLWLLNIILLAIPIGTTLGVLLGLQAHRDATGQAPLFDDTPGYGGGGGSGGGGDDGDGPPRDNRITREQYCDTSVGISPPSQADHYTLNPNPWGWEEGEEGFICMNVTSFNNGTYADDHAAPEWSVTWEYPNNRPNLPVHAYPNALVANQIIPVRIRDVDHMMVDLEWRYSIGNDTDTTTFSDAEVEENSVNTNVALDIFLDSDEDRAQSTSDASAEIMIWFATFGPATQPLGLSLGAVDNITVEGIDFALYSEPNSNGQNVFTWMASEPAESFHGDLFVLVDRLLELDEPNFPNATDYIGYVQFGTEAYSSGGPVTFHVPEMSIDIQVANN